mmetsp:Transcript_26735/g.88851  ORF Transcript_26735/g.88851 Transcript_26735/m.88851 type:complete len:264 (+) Transcript_26735:601-1392(+)
MTKPRHILFRVGEEEVFFSRAEPMLALSLRGRRVQRLGRELGEGRAIPAGPPDVGRWPRCEDVLNAGAHVVEGHTYRRQHDLEGAIQPEGLRVPQAGPPDGTAEETLPVDAEALERGLKHGTLGVHVHEASAAQVRGDALVVHLVVLHAPGALHLVVELRPPALPRVLEGLLGPGPGGDHNHHGFPPVLALVPRRPIPNDGAKHVLHRVGRHHRLVRGLEVGAILVHATLAAHGDERTILQHDVVRILVRDDVFEALCVVPDA